MDPHVPGPGSMFPTPKKVAATHAHRVFLAGRAAEGAVKVSSSVGIVFRPGPGVRIQPLQHFGVEDG